MVWQFWFALTPVVPCTEIKSRACRGSIQICLATSIIITTEKRGRAGGKLSALHGSCHLVHFDDSDEVLDELERYREYRGWPVGNPVGITAVGIKVPRKPQCQGPRYFKNLGDALAQLDTDHLSRRLAEFILTRRTV